MMHSFVGHYCCALGNGSDLKTMKGLADNLAKNKKLTKNQKKLWYRVKDQFKWAVWDGQTPNLGLLLGARHINEEGMYCYYYYLDGEKVEVLTGEKYSDSRYPNL